MFLVSTSFVSAKPTLKLIADVCNCPHYVSALCSVTVPLAFSRASVLTGLPCTHMPTQGSLVWACEYHSALSHTDTHTHARTHTHTHRLSLVCVLPVVLQRRARQRESRVNLGCVLLKNAHTHTHTYTLFFCQKYDFDKRAGIPSF